MSIGNSVTEIGSDAFFGCIDLESITVESGNTVYDSRDNCNALIETATNNLLCGCKNTIIPNSVSSISRYAFCGCSGLTSVVIPNSVTEIGSYAFDDCSSLTSVEIPNSVTYIGDYAFVDCDNLKIVFYNATNSKSGIAVFDKSCTFVIGENVKNMPNLLFYPQESCTVVSHATVPPVISASTFGSNTTVYVSSAAYTDYCAADVWRDMTIRRIETPVKSIALNVDDKHIDTNGSSQLTATITPADATVKTLYWSSDNPKVASVDQNGLVQGLSDGEATITAKAIDGSNLTATCTETVGNVPATDVTCEAVQDEVNPADFYATFSNNATDVELHAAAGATLTVYDVTVSGNTLVLTPREDNTVARGEAVLVKTSYSTFTASPLSGSELTPADYGTTTLLLATPSEAQTVSCQAGEAKLYRLTYYDINEKTGLGFYWGNNDGTQIKAKPGKGYLKVPTSQAAEIKGFRINPLPTHVDGIDAEVQGSDEPIYDLSGRRVENPTSGIYLQNNKKIIVK